MKTKLETLAQVQALAAQLAANHSDQAVYWSQEMTPPARLMQRGRDMRKAITTALLPIMDLLVQAEDISVAIFPSDGSKYSLNPDVESISINGGFQINCIQTPADVKFEREMQLESTAAN